MGFLNLTNITRKGGVFMRRRFLSFILVLTLALAGLPSIASAEGTDGATVTIEGTINPATVTISAPLTVSFSIDPNAEESQRFVSAPFTVINNSNAPVIVKMNRIRKTQTGTMTVVAPDEYQNWSDLNIAESETKIALGINDGTENIWSPAEENSVDNAEGTQFIGNESKEFHLIAKHGLAFSQAFVTTFELILSCELY